MSLLYLLVTGRGVETNLRTKKKCWTRFLSHKNTQVENAYSMQIIQLMCAADEPGADTGINCYDFKKNKKTPLFNANNHNK